MMLFSTGTTETPVDAIIVAIAAKGDEIRLLKANKAIKERVMPCVNELLKLKADYLALTGTSFDPIKDDDVRLLKGNKGEKESKHTVVKEKSGKKNDDSQAKGVESSVITPRDVDYSKWYNDVISASDMVDQSPVRGCMVIKPWGMGVWDLLRAELDDRIRETGTQNAYFPLFIPMSFLAKEAEHVDGFAKECAVVTHHRLTTSPDGTGLIPDPDARLEEPLIVRPTSETVIWNMFGKWINSYRDLPLKINQWANVVRWEMRTRPFLRSAEFLWQEGHTAHATAADAVETSREILDMYGSVCEDMLAIPTLKGLKSPAERFAGADDTYTIEALMQNGWALQSGTSHFLGLNFARAFDVFFQTETGSRELVWATSWGVSTRLVGAMVMSHSDDKGLVLPPPVAPVQVVIVPITKGSGEDHDLVTAKVKELTAVLKAARIRVKVDDRINVRPGAKYFEWERKGVPVRLEIGPRDLSSSVAQMALRHTGAKSTIPLDSTEIVSTVRATLETMHKDLLTAAKLRLSEGTYTVSTYADMKLMVQQSNKKDSENENEVELSDDKVEVRKAGFYLVPWKCDRTNEAFIKEDCKATIRCYPLALNNVPPAEGVKCFYSGDQATHMAIFARAF
eukprot:CAMPEP_0119039766 /NCGR_PEP_ID=MMETSP1177-20130426/9414_1 /TAXON_ID=2985 /ORGANISM="Ochromonas sp, Strain CCMP1899" /LENGTH=623 /DNA_ID=CAMNT_0007004031 /DNA_START=257 /DNA_END=2128 /DNA_ORIENTATION=-